MTCRSLTALGLTAAVILLQACLAESETSLLQSAAGAVERKDHATAVIQLKSVLQKNPKSAEARLLLGQALAQTGDPASAMLELRKARELQAPDDRVVPELARAMLIAGEADKLITEFDDLSLMGTAAADLQTSLATAHLIQGKVDAATESLDRALQADPQFATAVTLRARMLAGAGNTDEALAALQGVLGREPGHIGAGTLKGDILRFAKKDAEASLEAYREVLNSHPNTVAAHAAAMSVLMAGDRKEEARQQFEAMQKVAPRHPDTLFYQAQLAFGERDYGKVRELTDALLKGAPNNARVLELAGAAAYGRKAYGEAEVLLARAVNSAPDRRLSRQLLAQTYLRTSQPERALQLLGPLIDAGAADAGSLSLAGEAYLLLGDVSRAESVLRSAAQLAPGNARAQTRAAMAQLLKGGDNADAIKTLETLAADDQSTRADVALISARLSAADAAGALRAVDALHAKHPDLPLAYQIRGSIQARQQDVAAARRSFETALSKDAQYLPAAAALSALDLAAGQPEAARQRFEAMLKLNPSNQMVKLALAELSARTGAPAAEVTSQLAEAIRINPEGPLAHLLLVNQLLSVGDGKAALAAARSAIAVLPSNAKLLDALGRAEMASGNSLQAVSTFRRLADMQPARGAHHLRLAEAQAAAKNYDEAMRSIRRALELQPDLLAARQAMVTTALAADKPEEALRFARDIQVARPKDALGFELAGDVGAQRESWADAVAGFRAAVQREGATTRTSMKLHQALMRSGKPADADQFAQEWRKKHPFDAAFVHYLGDLALGANELAAAERHYRAVIAIDPRNATALNNLAWSMVKQSKTGAVAYARQANDLWPDSAPLLDTLATALAAEGQARPAIEAQKRAIALAPTDHALKLNLARLYIQSGERPRARTELEALAALGTQFPSQSEVATLLQQVR